jgi:hypothetical protein
MAMDKVLSGVCRFVIFVSSCMSILFVQMCWDPGHGHVWTDSLSELVNVHVARDSVEPSGDNTRP